MNERKHTKSFKTKNQLREELEITKLFASAFLDIIGNFKKGEFYIKETDRCFGDIMNIYNEERQQSIVLRYHDIEKLKEVLKGGKNE